MPTIIQCSELMDYSSMIPNGLNDTYDSVTHFIEHLIELNPSLIPGIAYFIKNLLHKYNVGGSIKINWDSPAYGKVFCGKNAMRQLYIDLSKIDSKVKVMFMVIVDYWHQKNKRKCKTINLNNGLFEYFWGTYVTISDTLNDGTNNINLVKTLNDVEIGPSGLGTSKIDGFISNTLPHPKDHYYRYSGSTDHDGVFAETGSNGTKARYIDIQEPSNMNITPYYYAYDNTTYTINNYNQLYEIIITWIGGSNTNGGDKADVHSWANGNYPRRAENLDLIFYDSSNVAILSINLWDTVSNRQSDGSLPPVTTVITNVYDGNEFTTSRFTRFHFGDILESIKSFRIQQHRYTHTLDNYGVKNIELKFKYKI